MKIKPTKRIILFTVLFVLSALPAMLVNSAAGYLPILTLLFAFAASTGQIFLLKRNIEIDSDSMAGSFERGKSADLSVGVKNGGILPVANMRLEYYVHNLSGDFSYEYKFFATLPPRRNRKFGFTVSFDHVGVYLSGIKTAEVYDIFGLFRGVFEPKSDCCITVLPKLYRMNKLPSDTKMQTESSRAVTASAILGSDYTGVREYVYGDPMKTIQWKLSAHSSTLVTKLLESYTNTGITMVLDMTIPDYETEVCRELFDAVIEASVSVGDYAHREGLDFETMFMSEGAKYRFSPRTAADYVQMLDKMVTTKAGDKSGHSSVLLNEDCAGNYAQTNIILCTSHIDEEIISALITLKKMNKNPILFYFIPKKVYDAQKREILAPLKALTYASVGYIVASDAQEVTQI